MTDERRSEVTFIDDDPPERYTITANELIEAPELTPQASFWLIYLKSKPKGWKVSVKHLATVKAVGRTAVENALNELIEHGYMRRDVVREQGRIVGQSYRFSWEPRWRADATRFGLRAAKRRSRAPQPVEPVTAPPEPENPVPANPRPVEPGTENERVVITETNQVLKGPSTENDCTDDFVADAEAPKRQPGEPRCDRDRYTNALWATFGREVGAALAGTATNRLIEAGWRPEDVAPGAWVMHGRNRLGHTITNLAKQVKDRRLDVDEVRNLAAHRAEATEIADAAFDLHAADKTKLKLGVGETRESTSVVVAELLAAGHSRGEIKRAMAATTRWSAAALAVEIRAAARPAHAGTDDELHAAKEAALARARAGIVTAPSTRPALTAPQPLPLPAAQEAHA